MFKLLFSLAFFSVALFRVLAFDGASLDHLGICRFAVSNGELIVKMNGARQAAYEFNQLTNVLEKIAIKTNEIVVYRFTVSEVNGTITPESSKGWLTVSEFCRMKGLRLFYYTGGKEGEKKFQESIYYVTVGRNIATADVSLRFYHDGKFVGADNDGIKRIIAQEQKNRSPLVVVCLATVEDSRLRTKLGRIDIEEALKSANIRFFTLLEEP